GQLFVDALPPKTVDAEANRQNDDKTANCDSDPFRTHVRASRPESAVKDATAAPSRRKQHPLTNVTDRYFEQSMWKGELRVRTNPAFRHNLRQDQSQGGLSSP